ncbi:phospho-sugar mutase [Rhodococcoides corynebacterioides]|uniref:Phospho-sugar mutase n=1 Tax=Rhodococcoides corynebacterioides TaxID=53972 RepID=A0ABS7P2D9_9NOCA|nr:phospho-sugar mutase [Rhodococcus corynebacterioides]MBY6365844.1 phospho-sugar mutase [Rhodococcus corynebacterioides]MBY6408207.1 phospho-sugar mutase [Rhodococcus corynebacterioides]
MTAVNRDRLERWLADDPDPDARAELLAASDDDLTDRFAATLAFGTAGLRGPVRAGPNGMNVAVVVRASAGVAAYLSARHAPGSEIVVGRDARHGSAAFAAAAAEVFAASGFRVTLLPDPLPTPILAFTTRARGAVAGVQITASHNPPADNGYKLYLDGGAQLVSPADREIEALIRSADGASRVPRVPVGPTVDDVVGPYLDRLLRRVPPRESHSRVRIALTPLHGVGGDLAVEALRRAGFDDVVTVDEQFVPDPDFPTVAFPNPEEAGAADLLLALAERSDATLAVALDPDADRCAVGVRGPDGWRMLSGDETGAVLADHILRSSAPGALVASTIVSSTLLGPLAVARGARHRRTLTGFKWLVRAGDGLVYAYEEAIGHCVDPDAVRDKDGISAAVLLAHVAAELAHDGRTLLDVLDDLDVEFGARVGAQVSRRVEDLAEITAMTTTLRRRPPATLAGSAVTMSDLNDRTDDLRTDAIELTGDRFRVIVRPSGTEPKLKAYLEVVEPVDGRGDLESARARGRAVLAELAEFARTF